ncbi:hypothetical protein METHB2_890001 [Candidatus Methylobacter favarea]|uniref:Uncharacterized protein n=1 Tax=Candidatus Methylobacter favarea TaxID=2707345 RepID=A0A8S0XJ34_9GAMM|nr:hypothetical protein METHB2_890001 [Candidatus Methylobacter favarea]
MSLNMIERQLTTAIRATRTYNPIAYLSLGQLNNTIQFVITSVRDKKK